LGSRERALTYGRREDRMSSRLVHLNTPKPSSIKEGRVTLLHGVQKEVSLKEGIHISETTIKGRVWAIDNCRRDRTTPTHRARGEKKKTAHEGGEKEALPTLAQRVRSQFDNAAENGIGRERGTERKRRRRAVSSQEKTSPRKGKKGSRCSRESGSALGPASAPLWR